MALILTPEEFKEISDKALLSRYNIQIEKIYDAISDRAKQGFYFLDVKEHHEESVIDYFRAQGFYAIYGHGGASFISWDGVD